MSNKKNTQGFIDPMIEMQLGAGRFAPIEIADYHESLDGVTYLKTTGDELNIRYLHDVVYAVMDGLPLHLQIVFLLHILHMDHFLNKNILCLLHIVLYLLCYLNT